MKSELTKATPMRELDQYEREALEIVAGKRPAKWNALLIVALERLQLDHGLVTVAYPNPTLTPDGRRALVDRGEE